MLGCFGRARVEIHQLVRSAQQAMQAGQLEEAAALWEQVLAGEPRHAQALFHLGQHALYHKDAKRAAELLQHASKVSPKEPVVELNLSFAYRNLGDSRAELAALDRSLSIDPYFLPSLLSKGALLVRLGQHKEAAEIYKNALSIAPPDDQLPASLRTHMGRARDAVARNAEQLDDFLQSYLLPARDRNPDSDLRRFEACKDVLLGHKKIFVQQPSMLHFGELPAVQFYDRGLFPWLAELEAATDAIRDEFLRIAREDNAEFVAYIDRPTHVPLNQWAELNRSTRWSVFFLWKDGLRIDEHCARCPRTAAALERVPFANIPNFAPTANFSVLAPHTTIPPHTGSTNVRLIVHLPLIVPKGCRYRVGNEWREWSEGKAWIFDDTIEHEAVNGSAEPRAILMFDIWNPYLSAAERDMVASLLVGWRKFYDQPEENFHFKNG